MAWYDFWKRKRITPTPTPPTPKPTQSSVPSPRIKPAPELAQFQIRRFFYNEAGFQTYASFFAHWDGWVTAGHCLTEAKHLLPDFAGGEVHSWPSGLDAATMGCTLSKACPASPYSGQDIICTGFPAGSDVAAQRRGKVYIQRPGEDGTWIAHIIAPDEPVVTGMSGGAVIDAASGIPIGIIITRNSPADLNNDRIADQSCDFVSLAAVWAAIDDASRIV